MSRITLAAPKLDDGNVALTGSSLQINRCSFRGNFEHCFCSPSVFTQPGESAFYAIRQSNNSSNRRKLSHQSNQQVIEQVVVSHAVRRVIGLLRVFEQDARLKPGRFSFPTQVSSSFCLFMSVQLRGTLRITAYSWGT
jgi:hypothetical protein